MQRVFRSAPTLAPCHRVILEECRSDPARLFGAPRPDPSKPYTVSADDQKGLKARRPPRRSLDGGGLRIAYVCPPLRPDGAIWQQCPELTFDLGEAEFKLVVSLALQMVSERIIFSHAQER